MFETKWFSKSVDSTPVSKTKITSMRKTQASQTKIDSDNESTHQYCTTTFVLFFFLEYEKTSFNKKFIQVLITNNKCILSVNAQNLWLSKHLWKRWKQRKRWTFKKKQNKNENNNKKNNRIQFNSTLNPINKHHLFIWRNETNSYKRAK